ncbi:predicted protein [Sclerotinia sclerotiorum 1980 UF-70]|uniref:Uncharacterized protein n=1 Tax=Sclerotinia sclerotiorum (strain ATCC 18683 / 1980 / Ss-1) TaxID=665079 RepID=A7ESV9_SCLS1|nr:predicted protein [Sclerotinia sclerotiorum 1980 UF-70]EDN92551.1 predicted protein [Sclerotinia sclerotiorum 1980 UF-70]
MAINKSDRRKIDPFDSSSRGRRTVFRSIVDIHRSGEVDSAPEEAIRGATKIGIVMMPNYERLTLLHSFDATSPGVPHPPCQIDKWPLD